MKKITLLTALFIAVSVLSYGQSTLTLKADLAFNGEQYSDAIELYKKAYVKAKGADEKGYVTYRLAKSYESIAEFEDAKKSYERAEILDYQKKESDVILGLAQNQLKLGDYREAEKNFEKFLKFEPGNEPGKKGLKSAQTVRSWLAEPTRYRVANESALNTENYDWALAQFDKKGEEYIFSSSRQGAAGSDTDPMIGENYTDLFITRRDKNGNWGEPTPLPENINSVHHEGAAVTNAKGNTLYFTRCQVIKKKNVGCDIYYADQQGKNWKEPVLISLKDSVIYSIGHPALDRTEKILIFASDMSGGQGGKDLWYSEYDKREKQWTKAKNLGSEINTSGDETFPYISNAGDLYFSSNGHVGMGGYDIFKAKSTGENKWGKVENMKSPINSFKDDYAFILGKNTEIKGFFTSNRDGGKGKDDLYSFELPEDELKLTAKVVDKESGEPLVGAKVTLTGTDGSSVEVKTNEEGMYTFDKKGTSRYIKKDVNYTIVVEAENHLLGKDKRSTFGVSGSKHFYHDFELQCTNCGEIVMPEVQYIVNTATFAVDERINSQDSLLFLYNVLVENPTITAELQAHTDCRGSDEANQELSQRRAQACVDFLVAKGIIAARLVAKGYGETQPRKIIEGGKEVVLACDMITGLQATNKANFDKYHQLNRRTTFSVLNFDYVPADK
jgi:peptidoglycan-associated lipoprotein